MKHLEIFEDDKSLVHIGDEEIFGFINDEVCPKCNSKTVFYSDYSADFCPTCNEWLKPVCDDKTCMYCVGRPEKPLKG